MAEQEKGQKGTKEKSFLETLMSGAKKLVSDPGAALKRVKKNASSQTARAGSAAESAAKSAGMALTRGKGMEPARNLRDVLKKTVE